MRHRILLLASLLLAASLLVACGGGEEAPANETATIAITMNDIYFGDAADNEANPPIWTVNSGATVTAALENRGALQHNWSVVRPNADLSTPFDGGEADDRILLGSPIVEPGVTDEFSFNAPEAGEYVVICTIAGHYPVMQGRLIVQ